MKKSLFASDLDNTLLFSHKHAAPEDVCVELYQGRPQGFFTPRTLELLPLVQQRVNFIPVTTRSIAQYQRITWPEGLAPEYAITTNGAVLLHRGEKDEQWSRRAAEVIAPWRAEIERLFRLYEHDERFELCRIVDGAYLFTARPDASDVEEYAAELQRTTPLKVSPSGRKIYFFPPQLSKGWAVRELKARLGADKSIAAGDSTIDIPMLEEADLALVPEAKLASQIKKEPARIGVRPVEKNFAEYVLESVLKTK